MEATFAPTVVVEAYQGIRARSCGILRSLDADQARQAVITCPDWDVTDLACHLCGVPDDILNGRLDNVGSSEWTSAQVDRHRSKPLSVIADEWEAPAEPFDAVLLIIPDPTNLQVVMDAVTHEYDLRLAVGEPGASESIAIDIAVEFMLRGLRAAQPHVAGQIEDAQVAGLERLRILTGRRSAGQLEALGIDATELQRHLSGSPMSLPPVDIVERSVG